MLGLTLAPLLAVLAAAPPAKPTPTPDPKVTALAERVSTLEKENSDLKSRLIECMAAATSKAKEPSAEDRAVQEALTALRGLRAATQGTAGDFRRYFIEASAKVEQVPKSHASAGALRDITAIFADANELLSFGAQGRANMLQENRWREIRAKYGSADPPGCAGVRMGKSESAVSQTFTRCGLALCDMAGSRVDALTENTKP